MDRAEILDIETQIKAQNEPPPRFPSAHHFAETPKGNIYARETYLPADTIVTGKIHKYETINFITIGQVLVANPEQPELNKILVAPYTFVSPPASKRFVMALQDTIWITVHPAESQDLGELESELIIKSYEELTLEERECLG